MEQVDPVEAAISEAIEEFTLGQLDAQQNGGSLAEFIADELREAGFIKEPEFVTESDPLKPNPNIEAKNQQTTGY